MLSQTILWVDFRTTRSEPDLCSSLPPMYSAQRLFDLPNLLQAVQNSRPCAVCFEYDIPDAGGLAALVEVKTRHSSLPIIMLTEKVGEKLETLALRLCVWDYLVKPMSVRRLCDCLRSVGAAAQRQDSSAIGIGIGAATRSIDVLPIKASAAAALAPAISYVSANCTEKLRLSTAAKLCDLSRFQFSRNFKKEQGQTFRDFVVQTRVQRAAALMRRPATSVTDAAFMAGFNDLSYFSRVFRRQFGVSPSQYRRSEPEPRQLPLPLDAWRER
jgi:two-component system, response regulator YesN